MTVLGVWAARDARKLARTLLPTIRHDTEGARTVLAVSGHDDLHERVARVGQAPTSSKIAISNDTLVLERGASWTAPIYYRVDQSVACSNLAPLLQSGDEIDRGRLAAMTGYAVHRDEARSVYRNIHLVRPFETVVFSDRGVEATRRPPPKLEQIPDASIDRLADELRERLFAAVRRTAGTHRVGMMLSGGLDSSSLIAALLAVRGASPSDIQVTLDFDAPGSDQPHVRALEDHYGISVSRISPSQAPAREALILDCAPSRHHGDPWVMACARRAHEMGAELLMTGTGGDGFFGGDLGTAASMGLLQGDIRGAWDALRTRFPHRASARHRVRCLAAALLRPHVPQAIRRFRAAKIVRAIPDWVGPILRSELARAIEERTTRARSRDAQERFEDVTRNPADSEYGAEARAQTDSVTPIPRVDPLYDEDLVQFLTGVRQQALFADGSYRGLLRRAMKGFLPESVRTRVDKSDFEPALTDAVWPIEQFEPLLSFESLDHAGIVQADLFRRYLAPLFEAPSAPESAAQWVAFWPALATEAFLRRTS